MFVSTDKWVKKCYKYNYLLWLKLKVSYELPTFSERTKKIIVLSQEEFAKLLGVSFTSINRWEAIRHEPIIKNKRKIVDLCKENNFSL